MLAQLFLILICRNADGRYKMKAEQVQISMLNLLKDLVWRFLHLAALVMIMSVFKTAMVKTVF